MEPNVKSYEEIRKGFVKRSEWNAAADYLLAPVAGLSDKDAADRLGVDESTVYRWRAKRKGGNDIGVPRGTPRRVLAGALKVMRSDAQRNAEPVAGGGSGVTSPPLELLRTIEIPEGTRRMTGRPKILSLFAHAYQVGVEEGFTDEELRVLEAWRDAELAKLREEERG